MNACISGASSAWMDLNAFITATIEESQTLKVCSESDESKRWEKERSRLINLLGGMVGGQAWIMPAMCDCLWSLLSHCTRKLDYHFHKIEWISPSCRLRGYWNLNLFLGGQPQPAGEEAEEEEEEGWGGRLKKFTSTVAVSFHEVVPLELFHTHHKFYPANLPVSLPFVFWLPVNAV